MFIEKRYQIIEQNAKSKFLIYAILDPETFSTVYIGRSSSGYKRPKSHFCDSSLKRKTPLTNWIKYQLSIGNRPIIEIISYAKKEKLNSYEMYCIQIALEEEGSLKNLTRGGNGILGYKRSEISKQKMSKKYKGKRPSDLCMLMNKLTKTGVKLTLEHKLSLRKNSTNAKKILCLTNNKIYYSSRHAQEDFKETIKCHKSILNAIKNKRAVKNILFEFTE